ncbi:glycosyltransferase family 1 protein [Leucobacter weissii]|uniref:Glycosyltransferase family 1 protein n=1 Tax=Leucobacter weissii TaxID=1983706 RepID=A0A939MH27_9MICO|nr:glycosyltransferase family 1 protein [Leucobacter weissii]MBO1900578.1 glycosyltransferase family 1 protein [Leucobacter weissii]
MTDQPRLDILVLAVTPFMTEPRGIKQVQELRRHHSVTTAGIGPSPFPDLPHVEFRTLAELQGGRVWRIKNALRQLFRRHRGTLNAHPLVGEALEKLRDGEWDLIVSNDLLGVPIANRLRSRLGVIADLHEYAPRQGENRWLWRLLIAPFFDWILRTEVAGGGTVGRGGAGGRGGGADGRGVAGVTSVGQGILDEYERVYGFRGELAINATPWHELAPVPTASPIKLVHSGLPAPARKLEVMIDAVLATRSEVTLDLYLMQNNRAYLDELKARAGGDPRIVFRDPVPYAELVRTLHRYDVGLSLIAPTTFNLEWCLPNKFFDFVQARLGVIIGPSPEMARFIERYGFGETADDFTAEALARVLDELTPERVDAWKRAAHEHARELSGEVQARVWSELVERIAARG